MGIWKGPVEGLMNVKLYVNSEKSSHKPFNRGTFQKNQCMLLLAEKKMGNPHMLCFPTPLNMVSMAFLMLFILQ